MNMNVDLSVTDDLDAILLFRNQDRQDSQYKLWTVITMIATTIFASMWIVFQYLKALEPAQTSKFLFGASLTVAVITNLVYAWIIMRSRPRENKALLNDDTLATVGEKK